MFTKSNYFIKEQISFLKLVDKYDILDADDGTPVAYAKENISMLLKVARLLVKKTMLPTSIEIKNLQDDAIMYYMIKPFHFLRSRVIISDKNKQEIGFFKSRIFTLGGRFDVYKPDGTKVAEVKGNWTGWNFQFVDNNGKEIGLVTKKWAGIGKELFTTADNYMISINPELKQNADLMALLIMAGLAIDIVYKEK